MGRLKLGSRLVPCYTPIGDFQCALLGSLLSEEELSLNISTGAQVSRLSSELALGTHQTRPYFDGQSINTFSHAPGGRELNSLVSLVTSGLNVTDADRWAFIAAAMNATVKTDPEVLPSFLETLPRMNEAIRNIRGDNLSVGHLFRATFEDMAAIFFECACSLWPERSWKKLVFSGGVAFKLGILREVIQARFGAEYRLSPFPEDTLFGLLVLARAFSGINRSVEEASNVLRLVSDQFKLYQERIPGYPRFDSRERRLSRTADLLWSRSGRPSFIFGRFGFAGLLRAFLFMPTASTAVAMSLLLQSDS